PTPRAAFWLGNCKPREANSPLGDVGERLLDHRVGAIAGGRVQDAAVAEPERDVVGDAGLAEADEIAWPSLGFVNGRRRCLLLVGVAWDQPAGASVGHVHEPRAVDTALRHPAPFVRSTKVGPRRLNGVAGGTGTREGACPINQCVLPDPPGIVVR